MINATTTQMYGGRLRAASLMTFPRNNSNGTISFGFICEEPMAIGEIIDTQTLQYKVRDFERTADVNGYPTFGYYKIEATVELDKIAEAQKKKDEEKNGRVAR